jgi:protein SCO1/2
LALYLSSFSLPVVGLTGSENDLAAMREAYFAHARRVPLESGGYTMDHTSILYLLDEQGRFVEVRPYGEDPQATLTALRALVS